MVYSSSLKGLKIIVEPRKEERDLRTGKVIKEYPGKHIKFVDGVFNATTQEEIDFLDNYMLYHQGEISKIDFDDEAIIRAAKEARTKKIVIEDKPLPASNAFDQKRRGRRPKDDIQTGTT